MHGRPCAGVVEWLVDNATAYRAIMDAIRGARETIWISQLAFDADCLAYDAGGSRERAGRNGSAGGGCAAAP